MSQSTVRHAAAIAVALVFAGAAGLSMAAGPVPVLSGGVSVDEFVALKRQVADYSLMLVLAAKGSGAYLADADVVVRSLPAREVVLEHRTAGPLLLAALPSGRYELTAAYDPVMPGAPDKLTSTFTVGPSATAHMVMYFDTGDKVSAESPAEYSFP